MTGFVRSKGFAVILLALAAIAIGFFTMQVTMWENYLLPQYPTATLNNISGLNFFTYFTVFTNTLCTIWMLLYAIGKLTDSRLASFISRPEILGALTVYIFVVGFLYWGVMIWFIDFYPKSLWMFNVIDVYQHFVLPATFTTMWLSGLNPRKVRIKKVVPFFLIYPLVYFIFSIVRGSFMGWYPYPFFNAQNLWETLFGSAEMNFAIAYTLVVLICALLTGIIYGLGILALTYNNKKAAKLYCG